MTEKVICKQTQQLFDIEVKSNGENNMPCPNCSPNRKKSKDNCMSYNGAKGMGTCYHDGCTFYKYEPKEQAETYELPQWQNFTSLTDSQVKGFEKRMIGQTTLQKMNVSTRLEWLPKAKSEVQAVSFPYYKAGELINIKFRGPGKDFKTAKDAELIWYNFDAIKENSEIIIVEGEFDALSFIQEGIENVISVPNGVNSLAACLKLEDFEHITKIYLAVDQDTAGLKLESELLEKFGSKRCRKVSFLPFKDANEYLCQKGYNSLKTALKEAVKIRTKEEQEIYQLLKGAKLDPNAIIEKPPILFSIVEKYQGGEEKVIPVFSEGDLSLLQGQQKSKKTFFNSGIITSMLNPNIHGKFRASLPIDRQRVAFFDTEQSKYYGQITNNRIVRTANNVNFDYYSMRTFSPKQRQKAVEIYLEETPQCSFIVIDGIVDMVTDFNDLHECQALVQWLMSLTESHKVHALNILHENIGDSQKARGHLGSLLAQKAESVIRIQKKVGEDAKSTIFAKDTRGREFKEFDLGINGNGEPYFENLTLIESSTFNPLLTSSYQSQIDMPAQKNLNEITDDNPFI